MYVFERQEVIPGSRLRDLKDRFGEAALRRSVRQWLQNPAYSRNLDPPPNIQSFANRYSEQVTADVLADINRYFQYRRPRTVGGTPTGLDRLEIRSMDVRPSNTAIASLGEGLAGWYLENQRLRPLARPIGRGVDLIFEDVGQRIYVLVEVKSTTEGDISEPLVDAALSLLRFVGTLLIRDLRTNYDCLVIGIVIESASNFEMRSLRMAVR